MTSRKSVKSAFESMMFTWGELLEAKTAAELFNISEKEAIEYFEELKNEYEEEQRGIRIRRINKSFQFVTAAENAEYIQRLCTPVKKRRLSQSALEVLAIVAYRQPVTRGEIDAIRGIKCDRVLEGLAKKELVEEKGRSNGIGRPILYGTTDAFLKYFGFENLSELPEIDDIEEAIEMPEGYEDSVMINQLSMDDMGGGISEESGGTGREAAGSEPPAEKAEEIPAGIDGSGEEETADDAAGLKTADDAAGLKAADDAAEYEAPADGDSNIGNMSDGDPEAEEDTPEENAASGDKEPENM